MTIFYITPEHEAAAQVLANLEKRGSRPHSLADEERFNVEGEDITVYAHSAGYTDKPDARSVAGKKPEKLAEMLAERIKNKGKVQKVYLLACEAGLRVGGKTYAEHFAQALEDAGFPEGIQVHAVAAPQKAHAMRVNVTSHAGVTKRAGKVDGQVEGIYYGNQYTQLLDEALSLAEQAEDQRSIRDIQGKIEVARHNGHYVKETFFSSPNYKKDLRRPENTFGVGIKTPVDSEAEVNMASFIQEQQTKLTTSFKGKPTEQHIEPMKALLRDFDAQSFSDSKKAAAASFLIEKTVGLLAAEQADGNSEHLEKKAAEWVDRLAGDLEIVKKPKYDSIQKMAKKLEREHKPKTMLSTPGTYYLTVITPFVEQQHAIEAQVQGGKQPVDVEKHSEIDALKTEIERLRPAAQRAQKAKQDEGQRTEAIKAKYRTPVDEGSPAGGRGRKRSQRSPSQQPAADTRALAAFIEYNKTRTKGYIRNTILNIVTLGVFGCLQACIFPHKTQAAKVKASEKIIKILEGGNRTLEAVDLKALQDGELGKLVTTHRGELPASIRSKLPKPDEPTERSRLTGEGPG